MMMVGFLGFAAGTWWMTHLTADWDFYELLVPQILRGVSLMLCMVPINNLALGTLPPNRLKNASGLFNLTRNLGGAVGLAVINTVLTDRNAFHYATAGRTCAAGAIRKRRASCTTWRSTSSLTASTAHKAAISKLSGMVQQQACAAVLHGRVLPADGAVRDAGALRHDDPQTGRRRWRRRALNLKCAQRFSGCSSISPKAPSAKTPGREPGVFL